MGELEGSSMPIPLLARLAFVDGHPIKIWEEATERLASWGVDRHKSQLRDAMDKYKKQRTLNLVWHSNELEGTLPSGVSQFQAFRSLEDSYTRYCEEASDDIQCDQLSQHLQAYFTLCESCETAESTLTEHLILKVHKVLMSGLCTEDGLPVTAGSYRQGSVRAGDHVYPPPSIVPSAMSKVVEEYNIKLSEKHDPFELASWLVYQVITIHPFEDGNGRLSRLLACYSLMHDGLPFPITITSGRRRSQKHFVWALKRDRANSQGKQPHLTTLIVISVWQAWENFFLNQSYDPITSQCEGLVCSLV